MEHLLAGYGLALFLVGGATIGARILQFFCLEFLFSFVLVIFWRRKRGRDHHDTTMERHDLEARPTLHVRTTTYTNNFLCGLKMGEGGNGRKGSGEG